MTDTLETPSRRRGPSVLRGSVLRGSVLRGSALRGRMAWIAVGALLVVAVGGLTLAKTVFSDDDDSAGQRVMLTTTEHTVSYEVSGLGTVPDLNYSVGEANKVIELKNVKVPWKESIKLPVGPAGGFAQISVTSPETGEGTLGCRVFVDGVLVSQQTSTDGYAGVVCSKQIPAEFIK